MVKTWDAFPLWSGESEDLHRLLVAVSSQVKLVLDEHVAEETSAESQRQAAILAEVLSLRVGLKVSAIPEAREIVEVDLSRAEAKLAESNAALEQAILEAESAGLLRMVIHSRGATLEIEGSPEGLSPRYENQSLQALTISCPSREIPGYKILLAVDVRNGLTLSIESTDEQWALATRAMVVRAIKQCVPAWRFVRNPIAVSVGSFVVFALGLAYLALQFGPPLDVASASLSGQVIGVVVFVAGVGVLLSATSTIAVRRFVPAFAVVRGGKRHPGLSVLWVAGSLVAAIVGAYVTAPPL